MGSFRWCLYPGINAFRARRGHFCRNGLFQAMILMAQLFLKRIGTLTLKGLFIAAAGAALTVAITTSAMAYGWKVGRLTYSFYQDHTFPSYAIAAKEMAPTYKNFPWDSNPLIGIAEVDLNNDKITEIISFPTEEEEQNGVFCKKDTNICPFYVLQVRGKAVKTLGIIPANKVDIGDTAKNGYWRLKVFNNEKDENAFVYYEYDPNKDVYRPAPTPQ